MAVSIDKSSTAIQLETLTAKRVALESLLRIGAGIQSHLNALEALSAIAQPTQPISPRIRQYIDQLDQRFATTPDEEVTQRLKAIEQVTQENLTQVVALALVDTDKLREENSDGPSVDDFVESINNFKRRIQTALALRFVLTKRGIEIPPFKLPFPQVEITDKITHLKEKEERCVAKIKDEVHVIIADTDKMLKDDAIPEKMKEEIRSVREAMYANLAHLDQGGAVADIPHKFEVVNLDAPPAAEPQAAANKKTASATAQSVEPQAPKAQDKPAAPKVPSKQPPTPPARPKKKSTLWLIMKWLTTPWSTSWKAIKEKYNGK